MLVRAGTASPLRTGAGMIKVDYLALALAGTYIGAKLLAATSKSPFLRKTGFGFADALVAAQIYIVVMKIRESQAAPVELPEPSVEPVRQTVLAPYVGVR